MRFLPIAAVSAAVCLVKPILSARQHPAATPADRTKPEDDDAAAAKRGRALFQSSCGFCHGNDATGSRAPDLLRSATLNHDDHGNLLGPVIRNGRPDKGMPSFSTLKDDQIASIVAFLHYQATAALRSGDVPGDYPLAKLLIGNAEAGKEYFNGAGGCAQCHSPTGDFKGIAGKYSPIDLQQDLVYPSSKKVIVTASVTTSDGKRFEGPLANQDEFNIAINCQDGWYRSWPRDEVKVEIHDPLAAHRELTTKYSDADIHNVFAYLETLK